MANLWSDLYKLYNYTFEEDPLSKQRRSQEITGAGVTQADAIPDVRQDGSFWGGSRGYVRLRDTNDFIDLSAVSNRMSRYKEYTRLLNVAEINMALTVMADESCLAGHTKIATLMYGLVPIRWLAENVKEPFLVYCYDFGIGDYTLGWAFNPRLVKRDKTIKVLLDDGTDFTCTSDHRILLRSGKWTTAGQLEEGSELMPFYRLRPDQELTHQKANQYPRIFTFSDGWKHERQFIDEWRHPQKKKDFERLNVARRMVAAGLPSRKIANLMKHQWVTIDGWLRKDGFSMKELKSLGKRETTRRVVGVHEHADAEVYDLSVKNHENFCGESVVFHNCQTNDDGHKFTIRCKNEEVVKELTFVMQNRKMLDLDNKIWKITKKTYGMGDHFLELITDPNDPSKGLLRVAELPAESMYRIETTKGKLIEFQQAKEGPDYESLARTPVEQASDSELAQSKAIRFSPNAIIHFKIGDDQESFYPYGQSLVEPARGPAHQLRLMEDAMVVYRLTRAPERRVFYIDVGQLPPYKAEAFIERMKDMFRKKKVATNKGASVTGASAVEERWHAPSADEDYWLPIRQNSNTRIDTLPGAQNLGEIDDAVYFRNKLFTALNFPKNYFANEDVQTTRITLSAQDARFARMIERLQSHIEAGLMAIAERHLHMRGFPEETYEDLMIKLTPPSEWRELSRAEITSNRINNASALKASMIYGDVDILTKMMKHTEEEAIQIVARNKIQKLEDLKLQIIGQNPVLLGVIQQGQGGQELGTEAGGPNPNIGPEGAEGAPPQGEQGPPPEGGGEQPPPPQQQPQGAALPDPTPQELRRYDLQIQTYSKEMDREEIDYSIHQ